MDIDLIFDDGILDLQLMPLWDKNMQILMSISIFCMLYWCIYSWPVGRLWKVVSTKMAMTTPHVVFTVWMQDLERGVGVYGCFGYGGSDTLQSLRLNPIRWWSFCFIHWKSVVQNLSYYWDSSTALNWLSQLTMWSDMYVLQSTDLIFSLTQPGQNTRQIIPGPHHQGIVGLHQTEDVKTPDVCCTLPKFLAFKFKIIKNLL